jgi:hypothetical protein
MAEKSTLMLTQENLELKKENQALKETVTTLLSEIDKLRNLPVAAANPNQILPTPELQIIEEQILMLLLTSRQKSLSLDDIRALDLLIKNKKALEANKPIEPDYTDLTKDKSDAELLQLAGTVENKKFRRRNKSKTSTENPVE